MRRHGIQMWMCAAVVIVGLELLLLTSSAVFPVLPVLGCMLMMGAMMWMMGETVGRGRSDRSNRS